MTIYPSRWRHVKTFPPFLWNLILSDWSYLGFNLEIGILTIFRTLFLCEGRFFTIAPSSGQIFYTKTCVTRALLLCLLSERSGRKIKQFRRPRKALKISKKSRPRQSKSARTSSKKPKQRKAKSVNSGRKKSTNRSGSPAQSNQKIQRRGRKNSSKRSERLGKSKKQSKGRKGLTPPAKNPSAVASKARSKNRRKAKNSR